MTLWEQISFKKYVAIPFFPLASLIINTIKIFTLLRLWIISSEKPHPSQAHSATGKDLIFQFAKTKLIFWAHTFLQVQAGWLFNQVRLWKGQGFGAKAAFFLCPFVIFKHQLETQNLYLFLRCCWDQNFKGLSSMNICRHWQPAAGLSRRVKKKSRRKSAGDINPQQTPRQGQHIGHCLAEVRNSIKSEPWKSPDESWEHLSFQ